MRAFTNVLLLSALLLAGCNDNDMETQPNRMISGGLEMTLVTTGPLVHPGETMHVTVTVKNLTDAPVEITANTSAPVYLSVWRETGVGWETARRYPEMAAMVMTPWTLRPGAQRQFDYDLRVEPDWPTHEMLLLQAELNGRRELAPSVMFEVVPRDENGS